MLRVREWVCKVSRKNRCRSPVIKPESIRADDPHGAHAVPRSVGHEETHMTPVIALPPEYQPTTASSAIVVALAHHGSGTEALQVIGPPDFPEGIDYDRWLHVVRPSPREAFADALDLDLVDD
jgi:hypothetical protein